MRNAVFEGARCTKQTITAGHAFAALSLAAVHKTPKYGVQTPAAPKHPACDLSISHNYYLGIMRFAII